MTGYIVFISALLAVFKPGIIDILSLNTLDLLLNTFIIIDLIYVMIKLDLKLKRTSARYLRYICTFWAVCLISTILYGHNVRGILVLMLKTLLLGLLCIYAQKNEKIISKLIASSFFVFGGEMFLNLIFMIILPYGSFTEPISNMSGETVFNYFLGSKNSFTTFALTLFLFAALYEIDRKGKMALYTYLSVVLSTYSMYRVNCVTGFTIFTALCVILLLRIYLLGRGKKSRFFIKLILISMLPIGINIFINLKVDLLQKLTHSRFLIWIEAAKLILQRPLIGYGMQMDHDLIYLYGTYRYSHNEILEILLYSGVLGFFLIIYIFRKLYKEIRDIEIDKRMLLTLYMLFYFFAQMFESQFTKLFIFYVICIYAMFTGNVSKKKSRRVNYS